MYDNCPLIDTYTFWTTCLAWYQEGGTYSSTRNIGDLPQHSAAVAQHPAAVAFLHSHRCSSRGTGWQIRTRRWQAYRHKGDFSPQPGSFLSLQVLARMPIVAVGEEPADRSERVDGKLTDTKETFLRNQGHFYHYKFWKDGYKSLVVG